MVGKKHKHLEILLNTMYGDLHVYHQKGQMVPMDMILKHVIVMEE